MDKPSAAADGPTGTCPICRKPAVTAYTPFCSKRCADVDLHRWFGGVYAVPDETPGELDPDEED